MYVSPDLNSIKETIALGGVTGAINQPSNASPYFVFISIVAGTGSGAAAYNSLQLLYDLQNGDLYARTARDNFTIFDPWYKFDGTAVS